MFLFFPVAVAFADEAAPAAVGGFNMGSLANLAPIILMFGVFYFLLIRPQQKKAKEHKEMLSQVQKGDSVITTSGIYGTVTAVADETLTVEIAQNVRVKFSRDSIAARKS